jgi:hypothetical protein
MMAEDDKQTVPLVEESVPEHTAESSGHLARRKFIGLSVASVPVVMTLSSRSAFAWHCKSPSAWGSEIINPTTSLKTNAGHQSYPDETWYITNWRDNVANSAAGFSVKPWAVLQSKFPTLKNNSPVNSPVKKTFDYSLVTLAELITAGPGIKSLASPSRKVKDVLTSGSSLEKSTLVGQLNYILLSPLAVNELERCLGPDALQRMAQGSYSPTGISQVWDANKITKYLYENYIAR